MKLNATMPFDDLATGGEFFNLEAVGKVGAALEKSRFAGAAVTDHPVPTGRWLDNGGHTAQDPFVMLALIAAATKRIELITGILVLPYRNPFVVARSVATLDVFSGGRVRLGLGAGYMKAEYKALGADFDSRNDIMDEYIKAMKTAWSNDEFSFEGTGYVALGNRIQPRPISGTGVPLWVGGNSKRAIRRAVELGDAWYPFFTPAALSSTAKTAAMAGKDDLQAGLDYMHAHSETVGRETPPELHVGGINFPGEAWEPQKIIDKIGLYAGLGSLSASAYVPGDTVSEWVENCERYDAEVLAKI